MQDALDLRAADARLRDLAGRRAVPQLVFVGASATVIFTAAMLMTAFVLTSDSGTRALSMDYRVFWAAARLALTGDFLAPFDMAKLAAVHAVNPEEWMPWLYPPGYLLLLAPFGLPSFAVSFAIMTVLATALMAWAVRPFTAGSATAWFAFALAPAFLPSLLLGQNSTIWFAILLAALAALRSQRWVLAGVLIGCLTLKPQLGVMIPVALLAAGLWRTILAASVTAILLAAVPTLVTGLAYWPLFFERLAEQGDRLLFSIRDLSLMAGPFYLMARAGIAPDVAVVLQGVLAAGSALAVFVLWRSDRVGFDAKLAVLMTAIFLSAPYLWYYEATVMALAGLFLWRAGILRPRLPDLVLLAILWLGAGLQAMNIYIDLIGAGFPWAAISSPAMLICLVLCLRHFWTGAPPPRGA